MPAECCKEFWNKIPEDEPVFILAARDLTSADRVRDWIEEARSKGVNPGKIARAEKHLEAILAFQREHPERCKLPD